MIKQCVICGKEFSANHGNQKICSTECQKEFHRQRNREYKRRKAPPKHIRQCVICGKEFTTRHGTQKTCSEECREEYNQQQRCEYQRRKAPPKKLRQCAVCGKEFSTGYSTKKTCSPECKEEYHRQRCRKLYKDKNFNKPKRISEDIPYKPICYTCGKSFKPSYPHEHFCSDACRFQSPLWIHLFEPKFTNQIIPF